MNFLCLFTRLGYFLCVKYLVTPTRMDFCILLDTTCSREETVSCKTEVVYCKGRQ